MSGKGVHIQVDSWGPRAPTDSRLQKIKLPETSGALKRVGVEWEGPFFSLLSLPRYRLQSEKG